MRNTHSIKSISFCLIISATLMACSDAPTGDKASVSAQKEVAAVVGNTFVVDTAASYVRFTGHGVGKNHPGRFHLASGELAVENRLVTGGKFVIDINSLQMEQQDPMVQTKLRPHLLSDDFFDAANFKTATFEITQVSPYTPNAANKSAVENANCSVSGNLVIRNITKNITFPARIDVSDRTVKAVANFDINRTDWNISYGNDKSLGDKFIAEMVNVEVNLQATQR